MRSTRRATDGWPRSWAHPGRVEGPGRVAPASGGRIRGCGPEALPAGGVVRELARGPGRSGGVLGVTDPSPGHKAGRYCLCRELSTCPNLVIVAVSSAELLSIRRSVHYRTAIWLTRLALTLVVPVIVFGPVAGLSALAIVTGVLASTAMAVAYMMLLQAGVPLRSLVYQSDPKLWNRFFGDVVWFRRPAPHASADR